MRTRLRTNFPVFLFCSPVYVIFALLEVKNYVTTVHGFMKIVAYVVAILGSLLLAYIVVLVMSYVNRHMNLVILLNTEFEQNGYSDKYIDILNNYLNKYALRDSLFNRCRYYVCLANAYLTRRDIQSAINAVGHVTPQEVQYGLKASDRNHLQAILSFFDIEMGICAELHNPDRADAVMRDAEPYIKPFYGRNAKLDALIDEINATYFMVHNEYEKAVASIGSRPGKYNEFLSSLIRARVYAYFGKQEETMNLMNKVKPMASSPAMKAMYRVHEEECRRLLGDV